MKHSIFILSLLSACSPIAVVPAHSDRDTAPEETQNPDGDTGDVEDIGSSDTGPEDTGPTWPGECSDIYDQDVLPTFDLDFPPAEWAGIQADCSSGAQNWHAMEFTFDGETVAAMARLKGNWSWTCDKLQFVISFNQEDPDARFHGLRKTILDAPWYDHTLLHERLAFPLFEARGLPYSCANNARVNVNGAYYGLYANLERIDHEYLERHFDDPGGNLYQGGSELETNEEDGDTHRLLALQAANTVEGIAALVDLDQAVAEWSVEAMIPAMDNYWAGVEINYYLYDHPTRGFLYLPYDLDISFGDSAYSDGTLIWPNSATVDPITYEHTGWRKEPLMEIVLADRAWCDRFVEELVLSRAAYSPEALVAQLEAWDAQISAALVEDPHKTFSDARHTAALNQLRAFFQTRADYVDNWLAAGNHCPARW